MAAIFKGQNYRITLETGGSLVGATVNNILYKDPDNIKGTWVGVISGTTIYYDVPAAVNNKAGKWEFQVEVSIGGSSFLGEVAYQFISNNIK